LATVAAAAFAQGFHVQLLVGHSRGANVVLMHAARFHDGKVHPRIPAVVAIAPRFDFSRLPAKYFSVEQLTALRAPDGETTWSTWSARNPTLQVTCHDLKELTGVNMQKEAASIPADTKVLLCHG